MGWASRWFRGLLGGGKKASEPRPEREKKRWGFGKSFREKEPVRPPTPPVQPPATPRRTYAASHDGGDEQNKRAIAVAAATAAVAEAAVAAAQAAAAVVRLTSSGRCAPAAAKQEEWAAVRIQAAFRGYLVSFSPSALRFLILSGTSKINFFAGQVWGNRFSNLKGFTFFGWLANCYQIFAFP